jgi:peptidoglycan/LPS O-acetylase OafA/YrhL
MAVKPLSGIVLTYSYCETISVRTVGWFEFFNLRLARIVPAHVATWMIATVLHLGVAWNYSVEIHPFARMSARFARIRPGRKKVGVNNRVELQN